MFGGFGGSGYGYQNYGGPFYGQPQQRQPVFRAPQRRSSFSAYSSPSPWGEVSYQQQPQQAYAPAPAPVNYAPAPTYAPPPQTNYSTATYYSPPQRTAAPQPQSQAAASPATASHDPSRTYVDTNGTSLRVPGPHTSVQDVSSAGGSPAPSPSRQASQPPAPRSPNVSFRSQMAQLELEHSPSVPYKCPIDLSEAFARNPVALEHQNRIAELQKVVQKIQQHVELMERPATNTFDDRYVSTQIDELLPPAVNPDTKQAEATRAERGPQDYHELRKMLKNVEKLMTHDGDQEFTPLFSVLAEKTRNAIETLDGTCNPEGEKAFLHVLRVLVKEVTRFMSIEIPNTYQLHSISMDVYQQCLKFEDQRESLDWTDNLTQAETELYQKVGNTLAKNQKQSDISVQTLNSLLEYQHGPETIDLSVAKDAQARLEESLVRLQAQQAKEIDTYNNIKSSVEREIADCKTAQAQAEATVVKLTRDLKQLAETLTDAHVKLWKEQKREVALLSSANVLEKKQKLNLQLGEHEEESTKVLLEDVKATVQTSTIAADMIAQLNDLLDGMRKEREAEVTEDLFDIQKDRLLLITRKFYKTSLDIFAAASSVLMHQQEQEGILTKKQRSNAAKNAAQVAECNRQFDVVQRRIDSEEAEAARLEEHLVDLQAEWEDVYRHVQSLNLPEDLKQQVPGLLQTWQSMRDSLGDVEQRQLQKMELTNHLDATWLANN